RRAATAELGRPRKAGVAGRMELALPLDAELPCRLVPGRLLAGMVLGQPRAQLVAECLLVGREGQVHRERTLTPRRERALNLLTGGPKQARARAAGAARRRAASPCRTDGSGWPWS